MDWRSECSTVVRSRAAARARGLTARSSSRWRERTSTSVRPFHLSGSGRSDLASRWTRSALTESSPRRVRTTLPSTPTQSPMSSSTARSKASAPSDCTVSMAWSWSSPCRRVQKASLPIERLSTILPATRTASPDSSPAWRCFQPSATAASVWVRVKPTGYASMPAARSLVSFSRRACSTAVRSSGSGTAVPLSLAPGDVKRMLLDRRDAGRRVIHRVAGVGSGRQGSAWPGVDQRGHAEDDKSAAEDLISDAGTGGRAVDDQQQADEDAHAGEVAHPRAAAGAGEVGAAATAEEAGEDSRGLALLRQVQPGLTRTLVDQQQPAGGRWRPLGRRVRPGGPLTERGDLHGAVAAGRRRHHHTHGQQVLSAGADLCGGAVEYRRLRLQASPDRHPLATDQPLL